MGNILSFKYKGITFWPVKSKNSKQKYWKNDVYVLTVR